MLLVERPFDFDEPGWIYEIKFDGYRLLAEFGDGACELRTRNGANATRWFPEITRSLAAIEGGPYVTDGEVCVLDDLGRSSFDRLQDRARKRRWYEGADPVVYAVFDLLVDHGVDITTLPLLARKAALAGLFHTPRPNILLVGYFEDHGELLFRQAVHQLKLEGVVAKRVDSRYLPGVRSAEWVKVKRKGAVPAERFRRGTPGALISSKDAVLDRQPPERDALRRTRRSSAAIGFRRQQRQGLHALPVKEGAFRGKRP